MGEVFYRFADDIRRRRGRYDSMEEYFPSVGGPFQWWALREIAQALGSPLEAWAHRLPSERPKEAEGWEAEYWRRLQPWRMSRLALRG